MIEFVKNLIMTSEKEKDALKEIVWTAVGEVSMCWKEIPKGEFDEQLANVVANKLYENIKQLYATK